MSDQIKHVDARELKRQLRDGGEIALLDARDEGVFGQRHLLMASCVPLSRLELLVEVSVVRVFGTASLVKIKGGSGASGW